MDTEYVKLVVILYKKAGMSFADFQDYYENTHSKLIRFTPGVARYMRRYFRPVGGSRYLTVDEDDGDRISVITELWFEDEDALLNAIEVTSRGELARMIAEDEENLFDKSKIMVGVVDERVTDLSKLQA